MAISQIKRYVRPLDKVRENMMERALRNRNPFDYTDAAEVERIFGQLTSLDRDAWAEAFSAAALPYEAHAGEAEIRGDRAAAKENYLRAYGYYRVARYPAPNSPGKRAAYPRSQAMYVKAGQYMDPPLERVELPFKGRAGEGNTFPGLVRRPPRAGRLPLLISWGGIDSFKEERRLDTYGPRGFVTLAMDMPGVADAPIPGSEDAERLWDGVFDWAADQPYVDPNRIAIIGGSTGGYWATKLAHTHRDRIAAAVSQGGCAHYAFTPEWIERAQDGEYPFELAETLACCFGMATFEEWVENAPRFSLLTQGILDRPCAPLLLINGVHDSTFPIEDMRLLLEHGSPKTARFYDAGHMGHTPHTEEHIITWIEQVLGL